MAKHRYSKVSRRIHSDEKVRRLTPPPPCGWALWMWLLTCAEQCIVPGLIHIGEAAIAEALGWDLEGFREAFAEVFREGLAKADWKARLVWIPNRIRHDEPANPNVILGWANDWDELPECLLKVEAYQHIEDYLKGKPKGWLESFEKSCGKGSPKGLWNQDQDQDQDQEQESEGAPPPEPRSDEPMQRELIAELARHPAFEGHDLADYAEKVFGYEQTNGKPWHRFSEWYLAAIRRVAAKVSGAKAAREPWPAGRVGSYLLRACSNPVDPAHVDLGLAGPRARAQRGSPQGADASADEVERITRKAKELQSA